MEFLREVLVVSTCVLAMLVLMVVLCIFIEGWPRDTYAKLCRDICKPYDYKLNRTTSPKYECLCEDHGKYTFKEWI